MAKFYSNENFPMPAVQALRALGQDVLTSYEAGTANQSLPDKDVLDFANKQGRILLTLNRKHFVKLHQTDSRHFGVVVCSFDPDYQSFVKRIIEAVQHEEPMTGKILRINRPSTGR